MILSTAQFACAQQGNLTTKVAQQVERIKLLSDGADLWSWEPPGSDAAKADSPVSELIKYGMDAVPALVPFLADTSFTEAYRTSNKDRQKKYSRVNEYIIFVINRITEHEFYLPVKPSPDAIAAGAIADPGIAKDMKGLQDQINNWWSSNHAKTLLERKIDDTNDPIHNNRFAAYEWIGRAKEDSGRLALERRINTLLTGGVNSLKQTEMAACAEALAKIGNILSAEFIRKVCDHFDDSVYMAYWPVEEGRNATGSMDISNLFQAYHSLSSIGFKGEALPRLQQLETKYPDLSSQDEFIRNMESARRW